MAGHGPSTVNHDAAIERWYAMRENLADNFKFNRKSGRFVFLALGLVPAIMFYGAYKFAGQLDFTAKRRNQSIWRN
ncbi:uncharacterized protein SAPINGB_P002438 [Magnusiomyces paraingens]|uniref:Uncharacterized protein n=1 Tax=Magnusiomyces paraingens TaxID=2606893 RepID=A0A5E8BJP6_9ASCO|nr:uncharacterized protein SAPINGB_P002438 [Saprochaete ingens]VVT49777.1 unnamed protein product [Saprochaete ingens]